MLDRAAFVSDFIRAHRGVADDHELVIVTIFVKHVPKGRAFAKAPPIILPHRFVRAVVEIEEFEILEFAGRCREQFLAKLDMWIHRSADVEEK